MHKFWKWFKTEIDVEIFSCVHGVSMIFMYGFLLWLTGENEVSFSIIVEMMILGYLMAWIQKGLFLKEKSYSGKEYFIREILWCLLPFLSVIGAGYVLHWFSDKNYRVMLAFDFIMGVYFVMIWIFLRKFYEEDTENLNRLLRNRRKGDEK